MTATSKRQQFLVANGHKSGLEDTVAAQLERAGLDVQYEGITLLYTKPARPSRYTPDFPLPNGIIIETKGRFVTADRQKHKWLKEQHPDLDIRFVFSRSSTRLSKGSPTTYAKWCAQYGFLFADKLVPLAWLKEPHCPKRWAAIERAAKRK